MELADVLAISRLDAHIWQASQSSGASWSWRASSGAVRWRRSTATCAGAVGRPQSAPVARMNLHADADRLWPRLELGRMAREDVLQIWATCPANKLPELDAATAKVLTTAKQLEPWQLLSASRQGEMALKRSPFQPFACFSMVCSGVLRAPGAVARGQLATAECHFEGLHGAHGEARGGLRGESEGHCEDLGAVACGLGPGRLELSYRSSIGRMAASTQPSSGSSRSWWLEVALAH